LRAGGSIKRARLTHASFALLALAALMASQLPAAALAQSPEPSWLDDPNPPGWNLPRTMLPSAPTPPFPIDPRFRERNRSPETPEDTALAAAGWDLVAPYQAGWRVKLITAASYYDGMGRPLGYQVFVFVDTAYAGTLSPGLMDSRANGALSQAWLVGPTTVSADFVRYAATDPLCCPTARSSVQYRIELTDQGPVVVPQSAFTGPTGPQAE
jgi:hypothetical protein